MTRTLDIIIVNWNTGDQLRRCIRSIQETETTSGLLKRLVVVDNASSDESSRGLELVHLPLQLIRNAENRGFATACNQGVAGSTADYLLFLNPDTSLFSDTLAQAVSFMEQPANHNVGICGVRNVDSNGATVVSCARFPSLRIFLGKMTGLSRLFPQIFPDHLMSPSECQKSAVVDQVIGAFFLVRRSLFQQLGGFDERFFVYFEEVDFSLRALQAGYVSFYLADPCVFHKGGGSSEQVKAKRLFYSLRSRLLYGFKHFEVPEALILSLSTLSIELASRLILAVFSLSMNRVSETLSAYIELFRYCAQRGLKWRS